LLVLLMQLLAGGRGKHASADAGEDAGCPAAADDVGSDRDGAAAAAALQGIAKTGSGKTAAFVLPMIVHVMDQPEVSCCIARSAHD
jgi:hypothetical protein